MTVEIIISQEQPNVTPVTDNGFVESVEITCYSQLLEIIDNQCNVPWIQANIQFLNTIKGEKGDPGNTPTIGENNHWFINGVDTGIIAEGKDGEDGVTPIITIGENENWYINGVDSGKPSRGATGTSAYEIYIAGGGTLSEAEFNESITDIPSHIDDTDIHVTTTDKSNWDEKADLDEVLKLDQTTPQTLTQSPKINDLVAGQMCYVDANKQLKPIDVFWDNVNKRMGVKKNNPSQTLEIDGKIVIPYNNYYMAKTSGGASYNLFGFDSGKNLQFGSGGADLIHFDVAGESYRAVITANGLGVGLAAPKSRIHSAGGIQCGDDTAAASADKVGTIRQRYVNNNTLLEFCKNVAGVYEWEKINEKLSLDQTTPQTIQGNVNINGNLNAVTTNVNQSTLPSVNASQDAAILQDGSAFTGTDYVMPTNNVAVKFVASAAHTIGDFTVRVKSSATLTSTTSTLTGYLYSDSAGSPSTLLATGNVIRHGSITTSYQELSLGTQYNLVAGTTYWLVIRWSSAPTGGNIVFDSNTDTNGGATSSDAVSWTLTNVRLRYRLRGRTFYGINAFSTNSFGVYGNSINSFGVYGISTNSVGVRGTSTNSFGVYGESTNYIGVYGSSTNSFGVIGESTNSNGVYGLSTNSIGVYGQSTNNIGVRGYSINNRAGYFTRNTATPTSAVPVMEIIQDHVSDTNSVLDVKQDGTGEIARFFDSGVEVASVEKGGLGIYKKGVIIGDNTDVASAANEFAIRGRKGINGNIGFSVTEMCMPTDVGTWNWVEIVRNEWIIP